ncbi:mavicyanin-like [Rosa sericea]
MCDIHAMCLFFNLIILLGNCECPGFAYSAAHGFIAEVKSKEEFESCDVSNPIRMFTDGLDSTPMDKEGLRYFTSSNPESCKNGLKLHVQVVPHQDRSQTVMPIVATSEISALAAAEGPTTPSGSAHLSSSLILLSFGFALLCYVMGH